jgi:hypothetical protein
VTSRLDGFAEGPHLVLREVVLEVPEELEDLLMAGEVVLLLLKPPEVVLHYKSSINEKRCRAPNCRMPIPPPIPGSIKFSFQ